MDRARRGKCDSLLKEECVSMWRRGCLCCSCCYGWYGAMPFGFDEGRKQRDRWQIMIIWHALLIQQHNRVGFYLILYPVCVCACTGQLTCCDWAWLDGEGNIWSKDKLYPHRLRMIGEVFQNKSTIYDHNTNARMYGVSNSGKNTKIRTAWIVSPTSGRTP
jgi:hypothetical protein